MRVSITSFDPSRKVGSVKFVMHFCGMGVKEASALIESLPQEVELPDSDEPLQAAKELGLVLEEVQAPAAQPTAVSTPNPAPIPEEEPEDVEILISSVPEERFRGVASIIASATGISRGEAFELLEVLPYSIFVNLDEVEKCLAELTAAGAQAEVVRPEPEPQVQPAPSSALSALIEELADELLGEPDEDGDRYGGAVYDIEEIADGLFGPEDEGGNRTGGLRGELLSLRLRLGRWRRWAIAGFITLLAVSYWGVGLRFWPLPTRAPVATAQVDAKALAAAVQDAVKEALPAPTATTDTTAIATAVVEILKNEGLVATPQNPNNPSGTTTGGGSGKH